MRNELNVTFQTKPVSKGTKTLTTVFVDGVEIGSRTTGRAYTHVLLVKRSQAAAIKHCEDTIRYNISEAQTYEDAVENTTSTVIRFGEEQVRKWAVAARNQAATTSAKLATLLSGPQPEFDKWEVYAWSSSLRNCRLPSRLSKWYSTNVAVEIK